MSVFSLLKHCSVAKPHSHSNHHKLSLQIKAARQSSSWQSPLWLLPAKSSGASTSGTVLLHDLSIIPKHYVLKPLSIHSSVISQGSAFHLIWFLWSTKAEKHFIREFIFLWEAGVCLSGWDQYNITFPSDNSFTNYYYCHFHQDITSFISHTLVIRALHSKLLLHFWLASFQHLNSSFFSYEEKKKKSTKKNPNPQTKSTSHHKQKQ